MSYSRLCVNEPCYALRKNPMKGYFKSEAKFPLMRLLGIPLVVIVVGMGATFFILHRH